MTIPTSMSAEHVKETIYGFLASIEPNGSFNLAHTRLNIIMASSHQNDSVETRLEAKRSRTAEVDRTTRPMHVPKTT